MTVCPSSRGLRDRGEVRAHFWPLDQHVLAAGNATVFKRKGYEFGVGIHYIGACGEGGYLRRTLAAAGAADERYEQLDPEGYDTVLGPDLSFRVPAGIDRLRERLVEQFPAEQNGIDRYIKALGQVVDIQRLLARPSLAPRVLPRSASLARWVHATFGEFLDSCTFDPRLRLVLGAQGGDYGPPPSQASVIVALGLTAHYLRGAYYPHGGGQVISDAIAASIEAHGGTVCLGTEVERIVVRRGRVEGVTLRSRRGGPEFIAAETVISNADLKRTVRDLVGAEHWRSRTVERVDRYRMAPALGIAYVGLDRDLVAEGHPRTNYWIYPTLDVDGDYMASLRGAFPIEPPCCISITSVKDPTHLACAPAGKTNLQLMTIVPSHLSYWGVTSQQAADGSHRKVKAYRERKAVPGRRLLRTAERALPGIGGQADFLEIATPLTHTRFTMSSGGRELMRDV